MALNDVVQYPEVKKGKGGLFGKIAGTVLGAIPGVVTGNPALAVSGAGMGGQLGGAVGEVADPSKVKQAENVPLQRMADRPNVQLAQLVDAQKALMKSTELTIPQKEELNQTVFAPTITKLQQFMKGGQSGSV